MADGRIYFYDWSLRNDVLSDNGELSGVAKLAIGQALDGLGVEAPGNPG